jgi:hypothetical protein
MQPHDDVHVFADGVPVSADGDQQVLAEDAERARHDQQAAEAAQRHAAGEEAAGIFGGLDALQQAPGRANLGDAAALDATPVEHAHGAAHGDQAAVEQELLAQAQQCIGLEHRVGIDGADERVLGVLDAGVEGIRLASAFLRHDQQLGMAARQVSRLDLRMLQSALDRNVDGFGIEVREQVREHVVGRPVVDHHDLELGIPRAQDRFHGRHDGRDLVVCGHEHRHGAQVRIDQAPPQLVLVRRGGHAVADIAKREDRDEQVADVHQHVVAEDQQLPPEQDETDGLDHRGVSVAST